MTQTDARIASDRSDRRYNAALAIAIIVGGVLLVGLARWVMAERSPFPDGSDGDWSATSVIMDGHVVDVELSLTVGDRGNAVWRGGCNSFDYVGGEVEQTQKGCSGVPGRPNPMEIDERLADAIRDGGELDDTGDQMTFDGDGFVVTFERSAP